MTGLRFREVMVGRVSLHSRGPMDGYAQPDAVSAEMRITIEIPDVAAYRADPEHAAVMRADVIIPVLGGHFSTVEGRFCCFVPGMGPYGNTVQQMIYSAGLRNADLNLTMAARKVLDPGRRRFWRVWRDTTQLQVKLATVPSEAGEPMCHYAGMVRLTLPAFLRQLRTMRPYGHTRWIDGQRARLSYVRFFVRGLITLYL